MKTVTVITVSDFLQQIGEQELLQRLSRPTDTIQSIAVELRSQLGDIVLQGDLEKALFQLQCDGPSTME